ncbi:MAG: anaerobic ribonucleoside-triphosphate reductase activating protein [Candidatus Margulisiibacteriota bacterium]
MDIRGFIETSFLDWDGKVSSVIFLPLCNLLCPFCNNASLLSKIDLLPTLDPDTIDEFLEKRRNFIDGVVITGGEPTLQPDLMEYIKHLKSMKFMVKLDTNGTNPKILKELLSGKLLDYVAMDIKAPLDERYFKASGTRVDLNKIRESIKLLMGSEINYEFRTTVCPAFHEEKDLLDIAKEIAGAKKYVLQQFVAKDVLDPGLLKVKPYSKEQLSAIAKTCEQHVKTSFRGV